MTRSPRLALHLVLVPVVASAVLHAQLGPPAVRCVSVTARVEIVDGVATTELEETLHNDGARPAEAVWVLPLAEGAVADSFRLLVGGVETEGEVLDAERARGVYEEIVRRRRDPGLLEYYGRGCLRARVFPVPAGGEVTARIRFREVLPGLGSLVRWSLAPAVGPEGAPPGSFVLDLTLRSRRSLSSVWSPTPGLDLVVLDDHTARASFEGGAGALPSELVLFQGSSDEAFGLDLLATRDPDGEEGTFLALISPRREWDDGEPVPRAITFVLDTSGSMEGAKLEQARKALLSFLRSLRPQDLFDVVPFSTEAEPFFGAPQPASPENVARARERVAALQAHGATNLADALDRGVVRDAPEGLVPITMLLTDGLPTIGVKDREELLEAARCPDRAGTRVFVFGVGNDVDTLLLDRLARQSGGDRDYVRPGEDIELETRGLFEKLSHPVMTDVELAFDGVRVSRLVPSALHDLFRGSRLEVLGRYSGAGPCTIRLRGTVRGEPHVFEYPATFADGPVEANGFLPALWAQRRVGLLLDAIRLDGADPELVGEVIRLGREYRIVTPYTSHLVLEEGLGLSASGPGGPPGRAAAASSTGSDNFFIGQGQRSQRAERGPSLEELCARLREAGVLPADADAEALSRLALDVVRELAASEEGLGDLGLRSTGEEAVAASRYLAELMGRGTAGGPTSVAELFCRRVGAKVFLLRAGTWTDRELAPGLPRTTVEAYSEDYFALLREVPALARYLAFSPRMVVVLAGHAYETVAPPG